MAITQFYPGVSIRPSDPSITTIFGGTQDNNVLAYNGLIWRTSISGGDGAATAIDPKNSKNVYISVAAAKPLETTLWLSKRPMAA